MEVTIDSNSGFCFGVVYAIQMAEDELDSGNELYCLGDIVHNEMEIERLKDKGLKIIDHETFSKLSNAKVLIRAHGEPPSTYKTAIDNGIELIDASCPVVLKLQHRIRNGYEQLKEGQFVVYGKDGHAEVNGLVGQTEGHAIIVNSIEDLYLVDFTKPIKFFSQTTQPTSGFKEMHDEIAKRMLAAGQDIKTSLESNDTLCRQVSNREPQLLEFAAAHDVILFVSGKKSSNGKVLYNVCKTVNPNTYFISDETEIEASWFEGKASVGICGATSTPMWLMTKISENLKGINSIELIH